MTYEELEKGLRDRGFVGISEMCSMGHCHLNEQHYVLLTDGLIIYSTLPHHNQAKYYPNETHQCEDWEMNDDEYARNVFTFEKLDAIIKMVDDIRALENGK